MTELKIPELLQKVFVFSLDGVDDGWGQSVHPNMCTIRKSA